MLALSDVATFGALCGLASFDRKEVKEKLLEHAEFTEVRMCSLLFNADFIPWLSCSHCLQILENAPAILAVAKAFHNIE